MASTSHEGGSPTLSPRLQSTRRNRHKPFILRVVPAIIPVLAVLALPLLAPAPARAQSQIRIASLLIRVWPEYDHPEALVFYSGVLAEDTPLPAELAFTLPPGAELNAAAFVDLQTGDLLTAPSTVEGSTVRLTTPNGTFLVEFYDPALEADGDQRSYSLTWRSDYDVASMAWEIQQPAGATGLSVIPDNGQTATGEDGLTVYQLPGESVPAGTQATITASYTRTRDGLTVVPQNLPPETTALNPTSIILITVGLLVIIAGVFGFYVWNRQTSDSADADTVKPRKGKRTARARGKGASGRFCTQCGSALQPTDRFCRHCGAKVS